MSSARIAEHTYDLLLGTEIAYEENPNRLAARYAELRPDISLEPSWQLCATGYIGLCQSNVEFTDYWGTRLAIRTLCMEIMASENGGRKFSQAALDELILRFMSLIQSQANARLHEGYLRENSNRAGELDHPATIEDLITIDAYIANPDAFY